MPRISRFRGKVLQERFAALLKWERKKGPRADLKAMFDRITSMYSKRFPKMKIVESSELQRARKKGKGKEKTSEHILIPKGVPLRNPKRNYDRAYSLLTEAVRVRTEALAMLEKKYEISTQIVVKGDQIYCIVDVPENMPLLDLGLAAGEAYSALRKYRKLLERARAEIIKLEISYVLVKAPERVKEHLAKEFGEALRRRIEEYSKKRNYSVRLGGYVKDVRRLWNLVTEISTDAYRLSDTVTILREMVERTRLNKGLSKH
jgi:hypothetical protein